MDEHTRDVLRHRLSKGTRKNYDDSNVRFIKLVFDNREAYEGIINPLLLGWLVVAHGINSTQLTKKGKPCKQRKEISKVLHGVLNNIRPEDPSSHPLELEHITFRVFTTYLRTFSKTISTKRSRPVEVDEVVLDSGKLSDGGSVVGDDKEHQTTRVQIRLSKSSYGSNRSGLAHLFSECGVDKFSSKTSQFLWKNLTQYNKGNSRLGAEEREALGLCTVEETEI